MDTQEPGDRLTMVCTEDNRVSSIGQLFVQYTKTEDLVCDLWEGTFTVARALIRLEFPRNLMSLELVSAIVKK